MPEKIKKMVIYDEEDPTKVIHLAAPTPGHFCYIEPAFKGKFPGSTRLVVQEVDEFPDETRISTNPLNTSVLVLCGELDLDELTDLIEGVEPERVRRRKTTIN